MPMLTGSFYPVAGGRANNMAWVKSEYAGELAVLSTWLVAIAPWSVTIFGRGPITGVVFRFLPFRVLYLYGLSLPNELTFRMPWQAIPSGELLSPAGIAGILWTGAMLVGSVAFVASIAYYNEEEQFADVLPFDTVRFFGGMLALVGLCTLVGTVLFNLSGGFPGTTVPVGALIAPVLAALLLTVDLT